MRTRASSLVLAAAIATGAVATLSVEDSASASISIAVTWDGLLRESTAAVVVTPAESTSVWESGRIYTYSHVHVERAVAGALAVGSDAWVRSMGGVVGKIGQIVEGEPVLTKGQPALLFVHPGPAGTFEVTARGQGQFPLVTDTASPAGRLVRSTSAGALVMPRVTGPVPLPQLAADRVHGRSVDDVARDVAAAWATAHGR